MTVLFLLACSTGPDSPEVPSEPVVDRWVEAVLADPPVDEGRTAEPVGDPPRPEAGFPQVDPESARAGVERDLRDGSERARICWSAALVRTPGLTGQVMLGFSSYAHRTESVYVVSNDTGDFA